MFFGLQIPDPYPLVRAMNPDADKVLNQGTFWGVQEFFNPLNCPERSKEQFRGQKSRGPLKMSREMAHKVIVPQQKIMSLCREGFLLLPFND